MTAIIHGIWKSQEAATEMAETSQIRLARLSYVVYEHPSIENFRAFAQDFGFVEAGSNDKDGSIYYRGYGEDPYLYVARPAPNGARKRFIGAGFAAESESDFVKASRLEGSETVDLSDRPGGGKCVVVSDPNGFDMIVLWGQETRTPPSKGVSALVGEPPVNGAINKSRKGMPNSTTSSMCPMWLLIVTDPGEFTRMQDGPAMVHKLGHFGYNTDNFEETMAWYQKHFNFVPTDVLYAPHDPSFDVAAFMRLERGKTFVDHHCFLVARNEGKGTQVHHSSFEVEDLDTQFMGHQWLRDKGHELVWGIGRHVHGSQVFDYWYDSSRFIIEHYADGDVVNEDTELLRAKAGNMAVWGPPVPAIVSTSIERTSV